MQNSLPNSLLLHNSQNFRTHSDVWLFAKIAVRIDNFPKNINIQVFILHYLLLMLKSICHDFLGVLEALSFDIHFFYDIFIRFLFYKKDKNK